MRIIVAVTGASGVRVGVRVAQWLLARPEHETHVILTKAARRIAEIEDGALPDLGPRVYEEDDFEAPLASGSFMAGAMVVAPCSMRTLAALAHGYQESLVARAGDIMLKMRRPLVVAPRETPLSLPVVENMAALLRAGATIAPPMLAFYHQPRSVADMVDFAAGKILDAVGLDNDLYARWGASKETP